MCDNSNKQKRAYKSLQICNMNSYPSVSIGVGLFWRVAFQMIYKIYTNTHKKFRD